MPWGRFVSLFLRHLVANYIEFGRLCERDNLSLRVFNWRCVLMCFYMMVLDRDIVIRFQFIFEGGLVEFQVIV